MKKKCMQDDKMNGKKLTQTHIPPYRSIKTLNLALLFSALVNVLFYLANPFFNFIVTTFFSLCFMPFIPFGSMKLLFGAQVFIGTMKKVEKIIRENVLNRCSIWIGSDGEICVVFSNVFKTARALMRHHKLWMRWVVPITILCKNANKNDFVVQFFEHVFFGIFAQTMTSLLFYICFNFILHNA